MLGPQQPAGCPRTALGLFRGKESQRLNSSQQVGHCSLPLAPCCLGSELRHVCFRNFVILDWFEGCFSSQKSFFLWVKLFMHVLQFRTLTVLCDKAITGPKSCCKSLLIFNIPEWFLVSQWFLCLFHCVFRASTLSSAVSSLANTGISFTKVDEREKQAALEEEQARLKALKVNFSHLPTFRWTWWSSHTQWHVLHST